MEYRNVPTVCPYCGAGCGLFLEVLDGRLAGVLPNKMHPVSQGKLCIKGWNAHSFVYHEDRLKKPLVKRGGRFVETGWKDALDLVANRLEEIKTKDGSDSIAVLASAKCTNEENYLIQRFTRAVLGTNNVDHCARLCHSPTVTGLVTAFGSGAMTNSIPEIEDASCIFVIGSNTTEQHPLVATYIYRALERGAKLIVAEPREIQLCLFADVHLRHRPGTDVALLNGMMHVIVEEGLEDKRFIAERTEGFAELRKVVATYTPQRVEAITGVPARDLIEAARLYAEAERASLIYAMGITQHTTGVDNVLSCANLAMLTGNVGRESTGVNPLRGQNNVQGACDMGSLPDVYPGYQRVDDEQVRAKFERAWGAPPPDEPGLSVVEMTNAAYEGKVKAMYIIAENPMLSDPDINHVRRALEALDFLVVQDIFPTETAQFADVLLPGVSFAEKDGTFTATDRRVQRLRQAIPPVGEAKQDWWIVCELAKRMEARNATSSHGNQVSWDYSSPSEIMDEIARLTPIYGGITYERLDRGDLQWPCRTADDPGTPYLHKDRFARGLGRFTPVEFKEAVELPDEEYPLILTTGRIMFHYHAGSMTRRSPKLEREVSEGYAEINPADAQRLGITQGEKVRVVSRRGEIEIAAWITARVDEGVVFIPFHFAEAAANVLTIAALDPVAKIPEYKVCAVRIERPGKGRNPKRNGE